MFIRMQPEGNLKAYSYKLINMLNELFLTNNVACLKLTLSANF